VIPALPRRDDWLVPCIDLLGCCALIGIALAIAEAFFLKIWAQVVGVMLAIWLWEWFFSWLRSEIRATLERMER
jgi:hypothetical protein